MFVLQKKFLNVYKKWNFHGTTISLEQFVEPTFEQLIDELYNPDA